MRSIRTLALTFVAALALSALAASAASAYEWQLGGSALTEATAVSSTSTVTFENTYEKETFRCTIARKGTVGPGGRGEITSVTSSEGAKAISCELTQSGVCTSAVQIEAEGLPWVTELTTVDGVLRNKLTTSPEWKIKCSAHGSGDTNWCEVTPSVGPHNVAGGVEETADGDSPHTACLDDPVEEPFVTSGAETLSSSKGTLQVAPPPLEWQIGGAGLTKAATVEWQGNVKLTDAGVDIAVECADAVEGRVEPAGAGEVTSVTFSDCTANGTRCEAAKRSSLEALNLPWHTELDTVGAALHDAIVSGGAEAPSIRLRCRVAGLVATVACEGAIRPAVSNGAYGVTATFDPAEEIECEIGGDSGELEGTQTIKDPGSTLEAD